MVLEPVFANLAAVKRSFVCAVLIPEALYSIIHVKYITFQLTNCQALEISVNLTGHQQHMKGTSSTVVLIHCDSE